MFEFRFDMNKKEFQLIISRDRPKTGLSKRQGDHITAYSVFLEIIYAAIQDEPISSVVNILNEIAKIFLYEDKESIEELQKLIKKGSEIIRDNTMERERRKETTHNLRGLKLGEDLIEQIKDSLKNNYHLHLVSLICNVGRFFIQRTNIMPDIARIRTQEAIELKEKDKKESTEGKCTEKESLRALRAYSELVRIITEGDSNKKESFFEDLRTNSDLCTGLRDTQAVRRFNISLEGDFNVQDLEKIELFTPSHIERIGYFIEGLFDCVKLDSEDTFTQVEHLSALAARHIAFIFAAFKHLRKMSSEQKEEVIKNYLEHVIEHQGWKNVSWIMDGEVKTLELSQLNISVKEYINKSYRDLVFPTQSAMASTPFWSQSLNVSSSNISSISASSSLSK